MAEKRVRVECPNRKQVTANIPDESSYNVITGGSYRRTPIYGD